jgi:hypothetical protein
MYAVDLVKTQYKAYHVSILSSLVDTCTTVNRQGPVISIRQSEVNVNLCWPLHKSAKLHGLTEYQFEFFSSAATKSNKDMGVYNQASFGGQGRK